MTWSRRCVLWLAESEENMKRLGIIMALVLSLAIPSLAQAQQYSIGWHNVTGGTSTSTGGVYSVNGTIGQADAGTAMSGGNYSLTGGFWSVVNVVQTVGAPLLLVSHSGNNIILSWTAAA